MSYEPPDGYYRIKLHALPARGDEEAVPEAYYGIVDGELRTPNGRYKRVDSPELAVKLKKHNAMQLVTAFKKQGFDCHCEPPIVVVY